MSIRKRQRKTYNIRKSSFNEKKRTLLWPWGTQLMWKKSRCWRITWRNHHRNNRRWREYSISWKNRRRSWRTSAWSCLKIKNGHSSISFKRGQKNRGHWERYGHWNTTCGHRPKKKVRRRRKREDKWSGFTDVRGQTELQNEPCEFLNILLVRVCTEDHTATQPTADGK